MKNLFLIAIIALIVTYAYIAINEKKQEQIIAKRVPSIQKVNRYEFSRALFQIRQARKIAKEKAEEPKEESVMEESTPTLEEDLEYLEKLRKGPANPAEPIDEDEFYHRPIAPEDQVNPYELQEEHEEGTTARQRGRVSTPKGISIPKRFVNEDQELYPEEEEYQQQEPEQQQVQEQQGQGAVMPSIPLERQPQE